MDGLLIVCVVGMKYRDQGESLFCPAVSVHKVHNGGETMVTARHRGQTRKLCAYILITHKM